jgi:AmiR/NasT family two-component response regulator
MGQRTLAFTKQMLRVFKLVGLEELGCLVTSVWSSIPRSSEENHDLIVMQSENEQAHANKHMCIRTLHHTR